MCWGPDVCGWGNREERRGEERPLAGSCSEGWDGSVLTLFSTLVLLAEGAGAGRTGSQESRRRESRGGVGARKAHRLNREQPREARWELAGNPLQPGLEPGSAPHTQLCVRHSTSVLDPSVRKSELRVAPTSRSCESSVNAAGKHFRRHLVPEKFYGN